MVLFVFDINNQKSFNSIINWMNLFNENNNGKKVIPVYLIGNKCDLEKKDEKESIDKFIKETGFEYKEMSTYSDDETKFGAIFQEIAEKIYTLEIKSINQSQKGKKVSKFNFNESNEKSCHLCLV